MSHDKRRGILFVLVGPGGSGKNSLMNAFMEKHPELIRQLATATTRPPRDNEQQGREHIFVSMQKFQQMLANNELLEHQEVTPEKFYGIPRTSVEDNIFHGKNLIADIEHKGAQILKAIYQDQVVLIFVTVPGATIEEKLAVLRQRMIKRLPHPPTEKDLEDIQHRLIRARDHEFPFEAQCQYTIINDDFETALAEVNDIIKAQINQKCAQTAGA